MSAAPFQDVSVSGTTTLYGNSVKVSYPIVLSAAGIANVRSSITKADHTDTYVTDGSTTCINGKNANNVPDTQTGMLARRIDFVPALSILREYANSNVQVKYAGTDSVNGSVVDIVALSFQVPDASIGFDSLRATQRSFYVDRVSGVVAKVQYLTITDSTGAAGFKTEVFYSQYQSISGFQVPFSQSTYVDGQLAQELTLQSAKFNNGLETSTFSVNCEVSSAQ